MPSIKVDIINSGLTRTGNSVISSETDTSTEAVIAMSNYESVVASCLSIHPWTFAKKWEALSRLNETPLNGWLYVYQTPADVLKIRTVLLNGKPIDYEHDGEKIYTNTQGDLVLYSTYRAPEHRWPAYFRELIAQKLEPIFLVALNEDRPKAVDAEGKMMRNEAIAKTADSGTDKPRDVWRSPLVERHRA